jgi:hypothetical protein
MLQVCGYNVKGGSVCIKASASPINVLSSIREAACLSEINAEKLREELFKGDLSSTSEGENAPHAISYAELFEGDLSAEEDIPSPTAVSTLTIAHPDASEEDMASTLTRNQRQNIALTGRRKHR